MSLPAACNVMNPCASKASCALSGGNVDGVVVFGSDPCNILNIGASRTACALSASANANINDFCGITPQNASTFGHVLLIFLIILAAFIGLLVLIGVLIWAYFYFTGQTLANKIGGRRWK